MASSVSRLRRWFALGAILMIATVAGMYFSAQRSLHKAVHMIPAKLGLDIQQTAEGFSISKSEAGRTQLRVSASKAVQFKQSGRAELHDVKIVVYGKDGSRFDRITGDDFEYDPGSGNVSAKGRVLIDLEANPEGMRHSDQAPPEQTKEPLHLETDGLVFNKNTGDASATGKVEFQTPQATGSAMGIQYVAKTGTMSLLSAVDVTVNRPQSLHVKADHGVITKQPPQVVLTTVQITRERQQIKSDRATFFLRRDSTVDRILAEGDVETELSGRASPANSKIPTSKGPDTRERSDRAELFLSGARNLLTMAILTGNVHVASGGQNQQGVQTQEAQAVEAAAGRATLYFAGHQVLQRVHAEDGVRLMQSNGSNGTLVLTASAEGSARNQSPNAGPDRDQEIEMIAPVMDFIVSGGRLLERAETTGPPQIIITQPSANQKTVVTAAKFTARFTERNRLASLHGEPEARIVSSKVVAPGKTGAPPADRISTSQMLDVAFLPRGGVRSITQTGTVAYVDGSEKAWAQRGEYLTTDHLVTLTGSPRVVNGGMTTTAQTIRLNRVTGDAIAEGNVKSTYSDLKAQPDGGMLAASDPIHVTSRAMVAHRSPALAVYSGKARLWQNANVVEAPTIQFDRDHRSIVAEGENDSGTGLRPRVGESPAPTERQAVSTVLVQVDKAGKMTPVHIVSERMSYTDVERKILLDGGVTAKAADVTMTGQKMTVFLLPRKQERAGVMSAGPGQLDRIIAEDRVVITQATRYATGKRLEYTSADDKFVLTGGPPSIFDAERGKTTGDSLTFFRHDDRVLVEGRETSPAVTRTQVAR